MKEMDFDAIAPYGDERLQPALQRLFKEAKFISIIQFLFPDSTVEEVKERAFKSKSIDEFYNNFLFQATKVVIDRTCTSFTYSGIENLEADKSYLFISNHRDIILDSSLLNYALCENQRVLCQSGIGNNLVANQWIEDIVRINKLFIVQRELKGMELYEHAKVISRYIDEAITKRSQSVWLSQREGRTKDGFDTTQGSVLKMLALQTDMEMLEYFENIRLVPISISYEYEPCLVSKVYETCQKNLGQAYIKQKDDDLRNIISGITNQKGKVHINISKPFTINKQEVDGQNKNQRMLHLQKHIDNCIYKGYKLFQSNYIAHDILEESNAHEKHYTSQEMAEFKQHLYAQISEINVSRDLAKHTALKLYANPVYNAKNVH